MFARIRAIKSGYLLYVGLFVLLMFVFLLTSFILSRSESTDSKQTPTNTTGIVITHAQPDQSDILQPGRRQSFTIEFAGDITPESLVLTLQKTAIVSTQKPTAVPFVIDYAEELRKLTIRTSENVESYSRYEFSVKEKAGSAEIFHAVYFSAKDEMVDITPPDQSLRTFLPHETATYRLVYNERLGSYVFNLKLNPRSPDNYNLQFEKARAEAEQFIENHGIDPQTLRIDWRRS
jgi:hypothetical protein